VFRLSAATRLAGRCAGCLAGQTFCASAPASVGRALKLSRNARFILKNGLSEPVDFGNRCILFKLASAIELLLLLFTHIFFRPHRLRPKCT